MSVVAPRKREALLPRRRSAAVGAPIILRAPYDQARDATQRTILDLTHFLLDGQSISTASGVHIPPLDSAGADTGTADTPTVAIDHKTITVDLSPNANNALTGKALDDGTGVIGPHLLDVTATLATPAETVKFRIEIDVTFDGGTR